MIITVIQSSNEFYIQRTRVLNAYIITPRTIVLCTMHTDKLQFIIETSSLLLSCAVELSQRKYINIYPASLPTYINKCEQLVVVVIVVSPTPSQAHRIYVVIITPLLIMSSTSSSSGFPSMQSFLILYIFYMGHPSISFSYFIQKKIFL